MGRESVRLAIALLLASWTGMAEAAQTSSIALVWRDHSVLLRETRILDYQAWPIPQEKKIHLTAVYFGRRVEGWIDGKKIVESEIPEDHPGARRGRFGLWAFETWCEFDDVKVTRLVAK